MKKINQKGITLIALVITIIVLLILAGVSIATLTGNNGILTQAQSAKTTTEKKNAEEKVKIAVMSARTQSDTASLEIDKLKAEIANQGGTATNNKFPLNVTMDGKSFTVASTGVVTAADTISKSTSYVGCYADIDQDGTVDGVIYADKAVGNQGSGQWTDSNGVYTIPTVSAESLKDYYISQESYAGKFGIGAVISPTGTGAERFYIMALTDIDGKTNGTYYDWYNAAYSSEISDYSDVTSTGFGTGKTNTTTMITKWNETYYGKQDACSKHKDMWGQIQTKVNEGWFVPSKAEWAAFAGELGISKDSSNEKYYENFGLSDYYWSSSQDSANRAWFAYFFNGFMYSSFINYYGYVRLSATF